MNWEGHVAHTGREASACTVLVGKPEGKRPLGRSRRCWESNIEMDLQEMDMIGLAHHGKKWRAFVKAAINFRVP
jgi:hypothetical protein